MDTATPAVAVALHDGTPGSPALAESHQVDARRHGELLLPAVERVLAGAGRELKDLTGVVVGVGPGPYTGLRVGLVTAEVLGMTLDVPVYGICTLDGIAYAAGRDGLGGADGPDAPGGADGAGGIDGPFTVATDARRKEVYWARYADARTRLTEPAVDRPADLAGQVAGLPAAGAGAALYPDVFPDVRPPAHQRAAALAALAAERLAAGGAGLLPPRPLYLRRPDAQVPAGYKAVTPKAAGPKAVSPR
ncbi:tRNA (adenosine(37)-N6)-threonylcarbamoyltransferase complex dimerization subunit type 1 TsaB [Streptomyces sp. MAR4 CNX-425]|uniref:tRNA (adenosine(37)-N6)-threonylcarbamoyltransferase complex dimerization subunit type 1 TsaB n=1 Tax=Streptomyces sp. MAR4 CNX-425 TaxID=3406343 RepID=UPI003B504CF0